MKPRIHVPMPDGMDLLITDGTFKAARDRRYGFRCRACGSEVRAIGTMVQVRTSFLSHSMACVQESEELAVTGGSRGRR